MLPSKANQNDEEKKEGVQRKLKGEPNIAFDTCSLNDLFNAYVYGTQILDFQSFDHFSKCHIHTSINVNPVSPQEAQIKPRKKILCYASKRNMNEFEYNDQFLKTYQYCTETMGFETFEILDYKYDILSFFKLFSFVCCNAKQELNTPERQKYPNVILENRLFLGDLWNRNAVTLLNAIGITHIVDITQQAFEGNYENQSILKVNLPDTPAADIDKYFEQTNAFIESALTEKIENKVFIHCQMGISRSTTITIAYLIKSKKFTLYDAYKLCQVSRPRIRPNEGFFAKLCLYEKKILGSSTQKMIQEDKLREMQECIVM